MTCGVMDLSELTAERVRDLLNYDSATGAFAWKYAASNRIKVGARAGSVTNHGYRTIRIDCVPYLEHRLAWLYMTGEWPAHQIDHINGVRDDNRFCNLRTATEAENHRNTAKRKNNSSGFKGVSWDSCRRLWVAQINTQGKRQYLGRFSTPEAAHAAYCVASSSLHGEFSRTE